MNKYSFIIALFIVLLSFCSCQEDQVNVDCSTYDFSNCNTTEPFYGSLKIKLTINSENTKVPIVIYKGSVESNVVEYIDTLSTTEFNIDLPLSSYYSVTAKYRSGSKTIIAVDGDDVIKKISNICDSTCWSIQNGTANVQLNY